MGRSAKPCGQKSKSSQSKSSKSSESRSSVSIERKQKKGSSRSSASVAPAPCQEDDKRCDIHCDAKVDVDLIAKPRVTATEIAHHDAKYKFALDFKHTPVCKIKHVGDEVRGCNDHRCIFEVTLGAQSVCKPVILSKPVFGSATFDVRADNTTRQFCTIRRPSC
jgi:hypothetical protein